VKDSRPQAWSAYWRDVANASRHLKPLVITELLTGFSLMALPFYVVYAKTDLGAPLAAATGWYLIAQVGGGVVSNFLWARLVDKKDSRTMLFYCALTASLTPLLIIFLARWGWQALIPIFFLAGSTTNYSLIDGKPYLDIEANCTTTIALLEAVKKYNPKVKIMYASTFFVNGNLDRLPATPESRCEPLGLYYTDDYLLQDKNCTFLEA